MAQEITNRKQDLAARPLSELQELGRVFYESGMFPDIRSQAQAIVKIQAGSELGFPPVYSMAKIYIVKGRVMVGAEALGAMVKRSGKYDYRVVKLTDTECELMFTDKGQDVFLSRFTLEDARRADLIQPGSGWYKWPRAMLMSKALSQGARIVCPHMISGAYVPEDFGMEVNEQGDIEGALTPASPPADDSNMPGNNKKVPETARGSTEAPDKATPAQIRRIMASAKSKGCAISDIGTYMKIKWQLSSTKELIKSQANELIDLIESGQIASLVQNMMPPALDLPAKNDDNPGSQTPLNK